MRILFMGTPDFAAASLKAMTDAGLDVVGVVSQPDRPKGRGHKLVPTDVKAAALEAGIENIYQPEKLRNGELQPVLDKLKPELIVVVAYGKILPDYIIDYPKYGCINVHASLLPKYRGAGPIQWAIINGEKVTGVTTMKMDSGLDTGDMLEKVEITLDKKETGGSLFDKLSAKGAALCVHTLAELEKGTITPQKQGESTTEYAKMLNKKSGEIDWTKTAVEIERLIRGLNPWPSAYTQWEGKPMKIWEAEVEDVVETIDTHEPGTITEVTKHGFKVQTGKGRLAIKSLQIPGKKRMEADAFLRGYHIETGEKLG